MPWSEIFPNNVIPTSCFDPVAANIVNNYVPYPNVAGDEFEGAPNEHARENQGTVRIDHTFSEKNSLTGFYYVDDDFEANPFTRFQAEIPNLLPGIRQQQCHAEPADQYCRYLDNQPDDAE